MFYQEKISCRVAIQVCVGYFPDGRERHRTFSLRGICPNASFVAIAAVIRALTPVLAFPITKVRKVTKREIIFYEEAVLPIPEESVEPEVRKTMPFSVPERLAARKAGSSRYARTCRLPPLHVSFRVVTLSIQVSFISKRALPFPGSHIFSYHEAIRPRLSDRSRQQGKLQRLVLLRHEFGGCTLPLWGLEPSC